MGTWATGPFSNDRAADYALLLDRTAPEAREAVLRRTLSRPADAVIEDWEETVAAAAVVAAQCRGGKPLDTGYSPQSPVPPLPSDLRELATAALVAVHGSRSLAESWVSQLSLNRWRTNLTQLYSVLTTASARPPQQPPDENPALRSLQKPPGPPGPPATGPRHR
ncbi:DUF4259 domain-containing protein [Streptomyces sp. NPDC088725]|uniref:DUF4259 domain-containing protein n=1 Tax=Streptomyces sp. NPDC088725 TaxID=3365873 RepID=UPI00380EC1FB